MLPAVPLRAVPRRTVAVLSTLAVLATALVAGVAAPAKAAASELFFSEYTEGSSFNKAIEIYNGTTAAVPLGSYTLELYSNGSATVSQSMTLSGSLAAGDVYVVAHPAADAALLAVADTTNGSVVNWNGDDAVVLRKAGVVVDTIGQVGVDPGSQWGSGDASTADNTIRRKATVEQGDTNTGDPFDPAAEWDGYPNNTFDGFGSHSTVVVDAAPSVTATFPGQADVDVLLDDDVRVDFSEPVDVTGAWYDLSCTISGAHAATVSGGPSTYLLDPAQDFAYGDVCTVTITAAQVSDQDSNDPPDTMTANHTFSFSTLTSDPCTADFTPVYDIQGAGDATPLAGSTVLTRGVVTANLPGLSGFAIQDLSGDGDVQTSDGVFVFVPNANRFADEARALQPGDIVAVKSTPKEFQGLTELDSVTVLVECGTTDVPRPEVVTLPEKTDGELEQVEGMLVTFPQRITVQQNFFLGRYGQLTVGVQGRTYQPTNQYPAGSAKAIELADRNRRSLFVLDDAFSGQNPNPIPYVGEDGVQRAGDTIVGGLTGILDFGPINSNSAIRDYRLQPTVAPEFTNTNERTTAPEPVGGSLKVASFNVLNYFTTFTGSEARGADNAAEFERQRTKIFAAMAAIDADVFGLMEIQNSNVALNDLVTGLNDYLGAPVYAAVSDAGLNVGSDAIKVAMIYKPATVTPVGAATSYPDPSFLGQGRVPVAQTFEEVATGERLSVVVNHFKSKGSCPDPGDDPANENTGDGQGCWNALRVEEAYALLEYIGQIQETSGDDDVLVIGDLNSYAEEDPILVLEAGGLVNEIERWVGKKAYSYVFDGLAGYLDHAMATESLHKQVTGATEWHINADEPSVIDYNTEFKPQDLYAPTPYRSSDHDPVVVGLRLR